MQGRYITHCHFERSGVEKSQISNKKEISPCENAIQITS